MARKFAQQYPVALMARKAANYEPIVKQIEDAGGKAIGISTDVSDAKSVKEAFEKLKSEMGGAPLAAAIFNVGGKFIRKPFLELTEDDFVSGYEANGRGGFLFAQAVLPLLLENTSLEYPPTLIFTSATAAMKGSALCSSFSTGKFAMRSLAQSLAREFGPKGVHVTHAIIDGVIDIERTKDWKFDAPDAKIKPEAVRYPSYVALPFTNFAQRSPTHTGTCILNRVPASLTNLMFVHTVRSGRIHVAVHGGQSHNSNEVIIILLPSLQKGVAVHRS